MAKAKAAAADEEIYIGTAIRMERKKYKCRMNKLAELAGIPVNTLQCLEAGRRRNPNPDMLAALRAALVEAKRIHEDNEAAGKARAAAYDAKHK